MVQLTDILNFKFKSESHVPAVEIYRRETHTRTQRHRDCELADVHFLIALDIWCETDARSKLRVRQRLRCLLVVKRANPETGRFVVKYHPTSRVGQASIVDPPRSYADQNGFRANVSGFCEMVPVYGKYACERDMMCIMEQAGRQKRNTHFTKSL
jgi:hypothetical protein